MIQNLTCDNHKDFSMHEHHPNDRIEKIKTGKKRCVFFVIKCNYISHKQQNQTAIQIKPKMIRLKCSRKLSHTRNWRITIIS